MEGGDGGLGVGGVAGTEGVEGLRGGGLEGRGGGERKLGGCGWSSRCVGDG